MYVTWPALYMGKTIEQLKKTLKKIKNLKNSVIYLYLKKKIITK